MIRYILLIFIFVFYISAFSQTQSDVNISEGGYGMVNTNIHVQYDHTRGQVSDGFGARVSYHMYRDKWLSLTANAKYTSTTVEFGDEDLTNGFKPDKIGLNEIHVMGQFGFTANGRTKLFGKPLMGIAMINSDWSAGGFERVSATMMGIIMLRANKNTQFGIGPLVMVNTSSKIPSFLVFMYRHRFSDKLQLNFYGGMFGLDYNPNTNSLLSIGADIDVKAFYFKPNSERLPNRCRFTLTSFRPMIKYRRRVAPNLYFDAQTGVSLKMSCRVNGKTGTKEYFECSQKAAPFVQCGVSYAL